MARNPIYAIIAFEVLLASTSPGRCTEDPDSKVDVDSKIVGGFDIPLNKAPFLASLQKPGLGHFCGGALLSLGSVLTGCHCLGVLAQGVKRGEVQLRDYSDMTVHVGSENIDAPTALAQESKVQDAMVHPNCSFERYLIYDFGVILVTDQFKESPTVHPFELVSLEKLPFDLQTTGLINNKVTECFVAGWGATETDSHQHSQVSKGARMVILPDADCSDKLGRENVKFKNFRFGDNAQMCSLSYGYRKNSSDCVGDSGGPFFCGKKVFGLVSYGYDCGFWDTPNVYAKLSYFVEWYSIMRYKEGLHSMPRSSVKTTSPFFTPIIHNSSPSVMLFLRTLFFIVIHINLF
ncbi:hypothetical protein GE061_005607 [Apolygus lucorum]|uniref:Peptidase S1 domain-containing protein n=1 Tax=Apolygus lucorum TaxID=248454 RepID=A0A8S9WW39_APOLU|nr:hypothetical protein GE061_005607 [Apolygus lucorum]